MDGPFDHNRYDGLAAAELDRRRSAASFGIAERTFACFGALIFVAVVVANILRFI